MLAKQAGKEIYLQISNKYSKMFKGEWYKIDFLLMNGQIVIFDFKGFIKLQKILLQLTMW